MAEVAVVEELGENRTLVQVVGGPHDSALVVAVAPVGRAADLRPLTWYLDGDDVGAVAHHVLVRPEDRAVELLTSLLTPAQLRQWRGHRRFWVPTPYGSVELGERYRLRFRPAGPRAPLVLCVVPADSEGEHPLPVADVWTTLLLMLRHEPERFFRVANWRHERDRQWWPGPVPLPT